MLPLSKCTKCHEDVFPSHVFKEVIIQQSPQHVALIYECGACGNESKVVAERGDWKARREAFDRETARRTAFDETDFRAVEIELDAVSGADDLVALWRSLSQPPLREEVMGSCGCEECERRLYG